jgi:hypothetical protein
MYDDMTRILKFRFRFFYDKHMFYFVVLNDSVELMICDEIVGTCVTMLVEPAVIPTSSYCIAVPID